MHPEIKKFWEDAGYEIVPMNPASSYIQISHTWFFLCKKNGYYIDIVGLSATLTQDQEEAPPCSLYILDGKSYSENEMLRIIKLKAFL